MKKVSLFFLTFWLSQLALAQNQPVDSIKTFELDDVVITASRVTEDVSKSPVTIERLSRQEVYSSPSPSFYDALGNVKGVQMLIPSVGFKVINTRGFGNTTNVRFVQMVDGMDIQAPHLGTPIANMLGPSDLDIHKVEIIPGTASALYGMNAINGLANFSTRDPFTSQGFSFQQKIGVNRINEIGGSKIFYETSLRYAATIGTKFALKVGGTFLNGTDWIADDKTDLNPNANATTGLYGEDNPAYDAVNSYGNESPNRRTLSLAGKNHVVGRTGYYEKEVVDYGIQNLKGDVALHYAFTPDSKVSYSYRVATLDNIYQRANRFRLEDYVLQQHGMTYKSKSLQLIGYLNLENTGKSYNARSMSENIDRSFKQDNQWFNDYTNGFNTAVSAGQSVEQAHHDARAVSDSGRPVPGTTEFNSLVGSLSDINNWDIGAALRVRSKMLHVEGQYNLTSQLLAAVKQKYDMDILIGLDHRTYIIVPDGNYFINPEEANENITYGKSGGFLQIVKGFGSKIRVSGTLRADKNEYYDLKWNPRVTAVYSPSLFHHLRISFQNGFRFPSVFEAFSNVNSGGVKRVGGLPVMSSGIFENGWIRSSIDRFQAAILKDVNQNGLTRDEAIIKNQDLLVKSDYTYVEPEQIRSLELGYRGAFFNDDLNVDIDFYYNKYADFIGQVEMNVPKTDDQDSIPFYLADRTKQDRYRMWTNSKTIAYNYGAGLGISYKLKNYKISCNLTYAQLERKSANDGLEDGFNTPKWIVNTSLANNNVYKNFGFNITYRWQNDYYWQSFLVSGQVPAYSNVDVLLTKTVKDIMVKAGGTNIINNYYNSFLGGPAVGGFYYLTVSFNLN